MKMMWLKMKMVIKEKSMIYLVNNCNTVEDGITTYIYIVVNVNDNNTTAHFRK